MIYDSRFGPSAQTAAGRAWVLQQMQALIPALCRDTPKAHQLRARYVAGELSWAELRHAMGPDTD